MTRTRTRVLGTALVAAVLLFTAACSDDDEPDSTSDTTETTAGEEEATDPTEGEDTTESTEGESSEGAVIDLALSGENLILVDGEGVTLYSYANDTPDEPSTCTEGCAAAWPALVGPASPGEGADEALIGSVTNEDGTEQATYNGWPLYYYAEDSAPGDTNGQGVGDVWWTLDAAGNPIET